MHVVAYLADGGGPINVGTLSQYGILGLVTAGLVWFAKGAYQDLKDRNKQLETENQRLNGLIIDRVIPALTSASNATEQAAELLRAIQREREQERLIKRLSTDRKGDDVADPG